MSENKLRAILSFSPLIFISFFKPDYGHEFFELLYTLSYVVSLAIGTVCPVTLVFKIRAKFSKIIFGTLALFNIHLIIILLLKHFGGAC
ncbi:hypothetical protein N474_22860 [Pseudoalteromonas luteoviolacea CPMOR-2]|nr:hypothetical protein N474_22860 [Pseudoalteromonas luteoviolacea CPMOR-2]